MSDHALVDSPLEEACLHDDVVPFLSAPSNVRELLLTGERTLLLVAVQHNRSRIVDCLLNPDRFPPSELDDITLPNSVGRFPLFFAALNGNADLARKLLQCGAPVNQVNMLEGKVSALLVAADLGHKDVVDALLEHDEVEVNIRNAKRMTPLFAAAQSGHTDVVSRLLEWGVDVHLADGSGRTPLYIAALQNRAETVQVLLNHGGCPLTRDINPHHGFTPLHVAASHGFEATVLALLLFAKKSSEKMLEDMVTAVDASGRTPLMVACFVGYVSTVAVLLRYDSWWEKLDAGRKKGVLHYACKNEKRDPLVPKLVFAFLKDSNHITLPSNFGIMAEAVNPMDAPLWKARFRSFANETVQAIGMELVQDDSEEHCVDVDSGEEVVGPDIFYPSPSFKMEKRRSGSRDEPCPKQLREEEDDGE